MKRFQKITAIFLVALLVITLLPTTSEAASSPKFEKTRSVVYDNSSANGVYVYTLKNLSKGQTVKWSLSGSGSAYARLKYSSRKVNGRTLSNQLIVDSNGSKAAKNKKITLTAKVYKRNGNLLKKVSTTATLKITSYDTSIIGGSSDNNYYTGYSYNFSASLDPSNSTDTISWSATFANGADASPYISQSGVFKPMQTGTFIIKATAYSGNTRRYSASKTVTVKNAGQPQTTYQTIASTDFTITNAIYNPATYGNNYNESYIVPTNTNNGYAHFRAFTSYGAEIALPTVRYYSSNPALVIDSNTGRITTMGTGSTIITVRVSLNGQICDYTYPVMMVANSYLGSITLDQSLVSMSNVMGGNSTRYINVTATDQYGCSYNLINEKVTISGPVGMGTPVVTYDSYNNQLQVFAAGAYAGDYNYYITIQSGSYSIVKSLLVTVSSW